MTLSCGSIVDGSTNYYRVIVLNDVKTLVSSRSHRNPSSTYKFHHVDQFRFIRWQYVELRLLVFVDIQPALCIFLIEWLAKTFRDYFLDRKTVTYPNIVLYCMAWYYRLLVLLLNKLYVGNNLNRLLFSLKTRNENRKKHIKHIAFVTKF